MKKLLSIILSISMLASVCCYNASAADTITPKMDLDYLMEYTYLQLEMVGSFNPIGVSYSRMINAYNAASDVLYDKTSTDADYLAAYDALFFEDYNIILNIIYVQNAYELSLEEENYNNWYNDEDWTDFVGKRDALGEALETELPSKATEAFYDMLYSYNVMTNRYTLKGDINKDGAVNVLDATLIQKYLVGRENLTGAQKMLTCAYNYESIDVTAATTIQKYSVNLLSEMPNNKVFLSDYETYESDERITERAFNFIICPRSDGLYNARNGFYDTQFLEEYYRYANKNNK